MHADTTLTQLLERALDLARQAETDPIEEAARLGDEADAAAADEAFIEGQARARAVAVEVLTYLMEHERSAIGRAYYAAALGAVEEALDDADTVEVGHG